MADKTKRRIRIIVSDSASDNISYNNLASSTAASAPPHISEEKSRLNIDLTDEFAWDKDVLVLPGRNKNDKNWENWERIREQKLEKMKNICFESYRQSKRDKLLLAKPKPKQLDPNWYTDNIYSNRSDDLEEDYVPDCLKYGTYRTLRNISEKEEKYADNELFAEVQERRGEGEGSSTYGLQRSKSCKEFHYPKSQSWCFEGNVFEADGRGPPTTTSILKNRAGVPKSYSFSATTKTTPFDIIDYELPPAANTRREKRDAYRRSMHTLYSNSLDERAMSHSCCARDQCTSAKCLLDDIYPSYTEQRSLRRTAAHLGTFGAGASGGSNRNLHRGMAPNSNWLFDERANHHAAAAAAAAGPALVLPSVREYRHRLVQPIAPPFQSMVICCCAADDYCCHRLTQHHVTRSRICCPSHHPAAEEEEHMHCHYDTDMKHFIRDEHDRLLQQDKFLDEDERYLSATTASRHYNRNYCRQIPMHSKSLLEVQPPSHFDEDTCSDTTDIDLEDFNIDLEKYWEELDKPPSPINIDIQRRNMHSNLKVKNVNVRCYNNGQPIDLHELEREREHGRLMIKKSLLEGMPSPPQLDTRNSRGESNNASTMPFFENASSPLHRSSYGQTYGHKIYPTADTLPSYQYNNFYPEHSMSNVLTQQPTVGIHHTSAGGHSALSLINNIFSIYKPNKYSPENCQGNYDNKPEPCKKMNVPSTRRPLGAASHVEYTHSMKRPLLVSADQPHFKIIPEKTGLKISPLLSYNEYNGDKAQANHRLSSTARPLMLPH